MGCGRSRHRSPALQPDGVKDSKDSKDLKDKDVDKRATKKQRQKDKPAVRTGEVGKRDPDLPPYGSPRRSTNGKAAQGRGDRKEGGAKREWQLEEAIDTPPETVMAVYKSSVPASARASLSAAPSSNSSGSYLSHNGSLLNGGSHKASVMPHDYEPPSNSSDRTTSKDKTSSGNAKPVHITNSQLEFFKMLDEKIEKGADYDSDDE